jgi:hypothetical protein
LDRGDIKDLITSMDDAIDQMNQTAKVITLFEFCSFEQSMQDMGEIIVRAAKLTVDAVALLGSLGKQSSRLHGLTEEIIRLEEQADQLHDQGRKELFLKQKDAIAFVIGTEVYNHLEMVVDRFEDVANEISAIVGVTGAAIVLSPLLGFFLALLLVLAVSWVFVRSSPSAVDNFFRVAQLVSAALYSLGHGGNDAQKTMGIIAVLLYSQGLLGETFYIPFWVILSCQAAMGLGTLVGGWRIVHTMGSRITRLHPVQGFCAEAGGAMTLFLATYFGIPVSTTHTITGAIVGVGAARKVAAVRWNVASNVVVAWIVTLPAAALFGAAFYELYEFIS